MGRFVVHNDMVAALMLCLMWISFTAFRLLDHEAIAVSDATITAIRAGLSPSPLWDIDLEMIDNRRHDLQPSAWHVGPASHDERQPWMRKPASCWRRQPDRQGQMVIMTGVKIFKG